MKKQEPKLTKQGVRDLGGNDQRKKKPLEIPPEPVMKLEDAPPFYYTDEGYHRHRRISRDH